VRTLAAAAAIFVVVLLVAPGLVPKGKIAALLTRQIETATGWRASVGDLSVSFLPPSVAVKDLVLSGNPAFDDSSSIRLPVARVRAKLGPLFRGSLQVSRAMIERPAARLAVAAHAGAGAAGAPRAPAPPAAAFPLALSLSRLDIVGASVDFADTTGLRIVLDSLDATLGLEAARGFERIAVPGTFSARVTSLVVPLLPAPRAAAETAAPSAGAASAGAPSRLSLGGLRCVGSYRLAVAPMASMIAVEQADLRVNDLPVAIAGTVSRLDSIPEVALAIDARDAAVRELLSLVPDDLLAEKAQLDASGTATIAARVAGPTYPPGAMRTEGSLDIAGGRIAYRGFPGAVDGIVGRVRFAQERLDIDSLAARFEGEPFRVRGSIAPLSDPVIDLDIDGALPLDRIGRWPMLKSIESLGGVVRLRVHAAGPPSRPQALSLDGAVDVERVAVRPRGWSAGVEELSGRVRLEGTTAHVEGLSGRLGRSDFRVDGTVAQPLSPTPEARLSVTSRVLDLDALAAAAGAPTASPAGAAVAAAPLALPELPRARAVLAIRADSLVAQKIPMRAAAGTVTLADRVLRAMLSAGSIAVPETPLSDARIDLTVKDRRLDGDVSAARVVVGKVPLTELRAKVAVTPDGVIDVSDGRARAFSGALTGDVHVATAGGVPRYTFKVKGNDLEMNDLLSTLTPLKDAFYGTMELSGDFSGEGLTAGEAIAKLKAGGRALAANGRITPNPALAQIADLLGLPELRQVNFRTLHSGFRVEGGRVAVDDFVVDAPDAQWTLGGSAGFDGSLDYTLGILLSKPLADRAIAKAGEFARAFTNAKGELLVDLVVSGTMAKPSVSLDLSRAMSRARGDALRDAARSLGVDESLAADPKRALADPRAVRGLLDKLGGRKKSEPARSDTSGAGGDG
jgi:uncharacterized protein involved in outer membrane biogenesis